jgi:hypothetical protein
MYRPDPNVTDQEFRRYVSHLRSPGRRREGDWRAAGRARTSGRGFATGDATIQGWVPARRLTLSRARGCTVPVSIKEPGPYRLRYRPREFVEGQENTFLFLFIFHSRTNFVNKRLILCRETVNSKLVKSVNQQNL